MAWTTWRAIPSLLVSRTSPEAYGLASLQVGYALSSKAVADVLNRVRQPFNVNSLALAAACAALDDRDYLAQSRRLNDSGMAQLEDGFHALGLSWFPRGALHRRGSGSRCRSDLRRRCCAKA